MWELRLVTNVGDAKAVRARLSDKVWQSMNMCGKACGKCGVKGRGRDELCESSVWGVAMERCVG